ncbi:uncharacterized protein LY89DRAFT_601204 [Mollisia scopiformis]|uniref:Uncharacterized protein n=1 Tax=Mollisia scopiformis TaxID=149040 RepID=A0A132B709_MOLSC|nr:uncharacterized protein LY89DRAFT_601204 [Mollisia scopiformis]KUJ07664.1 hypothetical protein LY89DRAFT_601204 [Mollisia scopiformis]
MSRNFRQKSASSPAQKVSSRGKQNIEESSDDDYGGVDQISDSEEDEPDVEVVEEQAIIESEDDQSTPRPFQDEDEQQWEGFEFHGQEEIMGQDTAFFEEQLLALANASNSDLFHNASEDEAISTRRVRFNLSDDDTGEDEDDGFFPDIFLPKDELDASFRREVDRDKGEEMMSDGSWEFHDHELAEEEIAKAIEENEDEEDTDSDDVDEDSSGYDIPGDESGYTTDEDLPTAIQFAPPRALHREPSQASQSSAEEEIQRTPVRRLPKLGVWKVGNKPYIIAQNQVKLFMFNRRNMQRRFSFDAMAPTPVPTPSRNNSIVDSSPMISNSGNIMMSAMANFGDPFTFGNQFLGGQALGPPEAFYPFTSIDANGNMAQDSSSVYDEDDLDAGDMSDLNEFFSFDAAEVEDEKGEDNEPSSDSPGGDIDASSTPARPTTARSEDQVHPLLDHFDKGVVGSFRRNQNRHQLLTRNIASRDSLAFGGSHLDGTIRGVKSGRLHHANTPITPARKAKNLKPMVPSSPASPLAQLNRKRKYNGEEFNGHKRNKSLI